MHASAETNSDNDWKLPANASFVILRFGACYGDGNGQGTSWFAYPQMTQVFPREAAGAGAGVDAAQGNNLVDFADFADMRTWVNGDINIEATAWNDNKTSVMVRWTDGCPHRRTQAIGVATYRRAATYFAVDCGLFSRSPQAHAVYESAHDATPTCYSSSHLAGRAGFAVTNMMKVSATKKYSASIWIKSNDTTMNNCKHPTAGKLSSLGAGRRVVDSLYISGFA